jgi:hypothetical protein
MLTSEQNKVLDELADTVRVTLQHQQYCSVPVSGHIFLALLADRQELQEKLRWRDMATEPPTENDSPIEIMEFHTAPAIVSEAYSYNDNLHNKGWWYDGGGFVVKEEDVTYWRPLLLPSPQPAKEQK